MKEEPEKLIRLAQSEDGRWCVQTYSPSLGVDWWRWGDICETKEEAQAIYDKAELFFRKEPDFHPVKE